MSILKVVTFILPKTSFEMVDKLFDVFSPFGERFQNGIEFNASRKDLSPRIRFMTDAVEVPTVEFDTVGEKIRVLISNETGTARLSPEIYSAIEIDTFIQRMSGTKFLKLDHLGFNLPWFDGVHPDILQLRKKLGPVSAYYRFPTGEEWDFILPVTEEELLENKVNLAQERRPKLEIVSFTKCSTPLIQIDFSIDKTFQEIKTLFPEGIADPQLGNVWVYIRNPFNIDICFVVGESQTGDWCEFFSGYRVSV